MANPRIIIELSKNLVGDGEQLKIDHADIASGWIGVTQILQEAVKASTLKAFEQIAQAFQQEQPKIELAQTMPKRQGR